MSFKIDIKQRFILLASTAVLLVSLLCLSFYQLEFNNIRKVYETEETNHVELHSIAMSYDLSPTLMALGFLSRHVRDHLITYGEETWDDLAMEFSSYLESTDLFDQIRFLDAGGMEIIRVNYNSGQAVIVPENKLQRKNQRSYFFQTIRLNSGEFYSSPLDLNIENGVVERPFKPTMRFGVPVSNQSDKNIGVIILNVRALKMLDNLNTGQTTSGSKVMLLNSDSYWLSSPSKEIEWGFMIKERKEKSMANSNPEVWEKIKANKSGQFYHHGSLYTFRTVEPFQELPMASSVIGSKQYNWKLVTYISEASFNKTISRTLKQIVGWGILVCALMLIGIWQWARISKQKQETEENNRKLSHAVEEAGDAILIMNMRSIIEYVNPATCTLTGYSKEELIGQTPAILIGDKYPLSFYKKMWKHILQGENWNHTGISRRKDGSNYPILATASPIHDDDGNITHWIGQQKDLTKFKKLEEQFYQAQKMDSLGTLVGGFAHDFNNMLAGVLGKLFLAKKRTRDNPEVVTMLDDAEKLAFHAGEIIKQMMIFAREDSVEMKRLSFNSLLIEAFELAGVSLPTHFKRSCNVCDEKLIISGDSTQIYQIIMNLVNNARDAMSDIKKPKIECTLVQYMAKSNFRQRHPNVKGQKFAKLSIRDNGSGMSKEQILKIFEPFFTTKEAGKGTGLGLAMVYGAMQSHGAAIDVESEPGKGTAFHLYFPLMN